jgi:hypothetical protein
LRRSAVLTIRIQLDTHLLRVEIIEIQLHFNYMTPAIGIEFRLAEA